MTKMEAIIEAVNALDATGIAQCVNRRGAKYSITPINIPGPSGWVVAEMVTKGNVHAYRTKKEGQ